MQKFQFSNFNEQPKTKKPLHFCKGFVFLKEWSHLGSNQGPPDYETDKQSLHLTAFSFKMAVFKGFIIFKKYFCFIQLHIILAFVVRMLYF